jgi:DNA-binding MarR family transcriptional regulator
VSAWLRLARVFQKFEQTANEQLKRHGLNLAQFDVLATVGSTDRRTQQEVADALLVTKSNVCQLLDRMERAGLVERRPAGRANRLRLTPAGRHLHDQVVPVHEQLIVETLRVLSLDEQRELLSMLRRVDRALP